MRPIDFLDTARELLSSSRGAPRQANSRKACSAAYYALFHTLCATCADSLTVRDTKCAWLQVYRAVDHGVASKRCRKIENMGIPDEIKDFADLLAARFYKSEVETYINAADAIIAAFRSVALRHRWAFAAYIVIKTRE